MRWNRLEFAVWALALPSVCVAFASPAWAGTVLPTAGAPLVAASSLRLPADYSSILADDPALADSGWATCESPISWTVDVRALNSLEGKRQIAILRWALRSWSRVSGLTFAFDGAASLRFNDSDFTLSRADGSSTSGRHIYFDFLPLKATTRLAGRSVAVASPSSIITADREIVAGTAIFRAEYVKTADSDHVRTLYLHELGHILGLGHAQSPKNIMYPMIGRLARLGSGDISGAQSLAKPCRPASGDPAPGGGDDGHVTPVPVPTVPPIAVPALMP